MTQLKSEKFFDEIQSGTLNITGKKLQIRLKWTKKKVVPEIGMLVKF